MRGRSSSIRPGGRRNNRQRSERETGTNGKRERETTGNGDVASLRATCGVRCADLPPARKDSKNGPHSGPYYIREAASGVARRPIPCSQGFGESCPFDLPQPLLGKEGRKNADGGQWSSYSFVFCQSAKNRSRPMSVSGWFRSLSKMAGGNVATSAPIRAA